MSHESRQTIHRCDCTSTLVGTVLHHEEHCALETALRNGATPKLLIPGTALAALTTAPTGICWMCGRTTVDRQGSSCGMPQPDGTTCAGVIVPRGSDAELDRVVERCRVLEVEIDRSTPDHEAAVLAARVAEIEAELEGARAGAAKDRAQIADYAERLEIVGRQRDEARAQAEEHRIGGLDAEVAHDQALRHLDRCRDAVAAVHESSERAPDVRLVPMRLVHEEAWQRMLEVLRGT